MASRGVCPHCESPEATLHFFITGINEEGFCCDQFCYRAYVKNKITRNLEERLAELDAGIASFKKIRTPVREKYKTCLVLSKITTHFLLKKDEAQYRLYRAKALHEWTELLEMSPTDKLLVRYAHFSQDFFEYTKEAEDILFR